MRQFAATLLLALGISPTFACSTAGGEDVAAREAMIRAIERHDALVNGDRARIRPSVLKAMHDVPRHLFMPTALRDQAYRDRPLPIGNGQTISQPYIVALMTDLLEPDANDVVLEVGTGSAYQAAVLSRLVRHVYTIEIVKPLAEQAAKRLSALGYQNTSVRQGDGYLGSSEAGPFDSIMVTAGADHIPDPLIAQLKPGGRLVMPVGGTSDQQLILLEKDRLGKMRRTHVLSVAFVPLTRRAME